MVNPFIASSKDYTKPLPKLTKKSYIRLTGTLHREKAAICYLRSHFNYSINELSQFFGRSCSLIHRTLQFNSAVGALSFRDERKLPNQVRLASAKVHRLTIGRFMDLWASFILGETDRPP